MTATNLYMVYQVIDGDNILLSICGSRDSLARIIIHYNEMGYENIKTKKIVQNIPYLNLFKDEIMAIKEDEKEYINGNKYE